MFTPLIDIVGDKKIMTHETVVGDYETNIYQITDDGLPWLDRHIRTMAESAIKCHQKAVEELRNPQERNVHDGICDSCGKERLLVFKKRDGSWYCSQCRDLFREGCE